MLVNIKVPALFEEKEERTVAAWYVAKGERFKKGQVLLSVETCKAAVDVQATEAGVLTEIRRRVGESVHIGDVVGIFSAEDWDAERADFLSTFE